MTDLVLRDIDTVLADRIRKVAQTNAWTVHQAILHLIERGLYASEGGALRFDGAESDVMQSMIAALETVPNDPGFSLIGRFGDASPSVDGPAIHRAGGFDTGELEHFLQNVPIGTKLGSR